MKTLIAILLVTFIGMKTVDVLILEPVADFTSNVNELQSYNEICKQTSICVEGSL